MLPTSKIGQCVPQPHKINKVISTRLNQSSLVLDWRAKAQQSHVCPSHGRITDPSEEGHVGYEHALTHHLSQIVGRHMPRVGVQLVNGALRKCFHQCQRPRPGSHYWNCYELSYSRTYRAFLNLILLSWRRRPGGTPQPPPSRT